MKLVSHVLRTAGRDITIVGVMAAGGGVTTALFVALVNAALHHQLGRPVLIAGFGLVLVAKVVSSLVLNRLQVRLAQDSVFRICDELCHRIVNTPYHRLEGIGAARMLACLTDDVAVLSAAIQAIPALAVNVAVLIGCGIYLAWLSWVAVTALFGFVLLGALSYRLLLVRAQIAVRKAREARNTLFAHFRSLTEGLKELQLSRRRRESFLAEDIGRTMEYLRDQNVLAMTRYANADASSQFVFYAMLTLLLFGLPALGGITPEALTAYIFTALYIRGPVSGIIGGLPAFARGDEALRRLSELNLPLAPAQRAFTEPPPVSRTPPSIVFHDVAFTYSDLAGGPGFTLGPLNLQLGSGELVFVIGGNGSGKSTFVKLLTGLYTPDSGVISVDGKAVSTETAQRYREHFSVVYSDFFLFERLHGICNAALAANAQRYLRALRLEQKVTIEGDRFSTTALSQGQRRRLALLIAYFEDRPIYVLDEWAADQDPCFRQVFYTELLPDLKARGKTVIVVTHDDRYFHLGDRIIKLDYGKVEACPPNRHPLSPETRTILVMPSWHDGASPRTPQSAEWGGQNNTHSKASAAG